MPMGDVLFYRAMDNDIDRAVVAAQAAAGSPSQFVHVGILISDDFGVEAILPFVRVFAVADDEPAARFSPAYPNGALAAAKAAILQVGKPYDAPGVALFGVGMVIPSWRDRLMQIESPLQQHTLWCSQLVAICLQAGGIMPPSPTDWTSPADIARFLGVQEPQ